MKMIHKCVGVAVLTASTVTPVQAEIFGVIKTESENIVLADVRGFCPVDYNLALRMISRDGETRGQGGCYRITPDNKIKVFIVADNNPNGRLYSFDDFVLSDFYRKMNPLAN